MPQPEQIYMVPYPEGRPPCACRLRAIGRRVFHFRLLKCLRPYLRRWFSVTEPAGVIRLQSRINGRPPNVRQSLTVVSANLWHDWPRHRRLSQRVEEFARMVETHHADLVLLQEVARTPYLHVDEWLAERLDMDFVYSRANGHESIGFEEGLAVLSRFPIETTYLRELSHTCNPFSRRLALGARIVTPNGALMAVSTHLGLLPSQNADQLGRLRAWVADLAGDHPVLVGGDFNASETAPQIDQARASWLDTFRMLHPGADGATHELRWPWGGVLRRQRLDYIFLRPGKPHWDVLETLHLTSAGNPHSDHRLVLTRLLPVLV